MHQRNARSIAQSTIIITFKYTHNFTNFNETICTKIIIKSATVLWVEKQELVNLLIFTY